MKNIFIVAVILFLFAPVLAQTENKNPAEADSKTGSVSQNSDYSESVPYKPREFKVEKKPKSKKKKKSKKDEEKENQIAQLDNEAQTETVENPGSVENFPIMLPVSVLDADGKPVQNLKKSDFKVFVDEQEQEIAEFRTDESPLNVILVLDVSPSTTFEIEEIQKYAATIIKQLRPQDKVMVITFDERTQIVAELTGDHRQASEAVKKVKFGDGTGLYEAVKYSLRENIRQINGRKFIVMITDGVDTTSRSATYKDSLLEAEKADAIFFPVYVDTSQNMSGTIRKSTVNNSLLQQILSQGTYVRTSSKDIKEEYELGRQYLTDLTLLSGGKAITIKNFPEINKTKFENVFEAFRNQFNIVVNYSGNGKGTKRKQIKVRVNRPNLTVKARGSYIIGKNNQTLPVNSK